MKTFDKWDIAAIQAVKSEQKYKIDYIKDIWELRSYYKAETSYLFHHFFELILSNNLANEREILEIIDNGSRNNAWKFEGFYYSSFDAYPDYYTGLLAATLSFFQLMEVKKIPNYLEITKGDKEFYKNIS